MVIKLKRLQRRFYLDGDYVCFKRGRATVQLPTGYDCLADTGANCCVADSDTLAQLVDVDPGRLAKVLKKIQNDGIPAKISDFRFHWIKTRAGPVYGLILPSVAVWLDNTQVATVDLFTTSIVETAVLGTPVLDHVTYWTEPSSKEQGPRAFIRV